MQKPSDLYTAEWFAAKKRGSPQHKAKLEMAAVLDAMYHPASVLDVGCGLGWMLEHWADNRPNTLPVGLDIAASVISPLAAESLRGFISPGNLQGAWADRFCGESSYDLTLCVEVAEHLHEIYALHLVAQLTRTSRHIFFSAATPGQKGTGHVNCQPVAYWVDLFRAEGYEPNIADMRQFRKSCTEPACGQIKRHCLILEKQL